MRKNTEHTEVREPRYQGRKRTGRLKQRTEYFELFHQARGPLNDEGKVSPASITLDSRPSTQRRYNADHGLSNNRLIRFAQIGLPMFVGGGVILLQKFGFLHENKL